MESSDLQKKSPSAVNKPDKSGKLFTLGAADFNEQGKLGALLIEVLGEAWTRDAEAARRAGQYGVAAADELMAADDFYFSNAELMNCCLFARSAGQIIGAACVNPSTATLHFLVVKPDFRRHGVGRHLLAAAEMVAKHYRHRALKLDFPLAPEFDGAPQFLEKCGYSVITRRLTYGKLLK